MIEKLNGQQKKKQFPLAIARALIANGEKHNPLNFLIGRKADQIQ